MFTDDNHDDNQYLPIDDPNMFYYEMHGRKFSFLNESYLLPVDEDEIQRSDLLHRLIKFIFNGRIYCGPVRETLQFGDYRNVLDLGTGKGSWAVELSEEFCWVRVAGVDVVPIQFTEVPPRCRFEIWDINTYDMPYEDGHFDLIHARFVHEGIRDYPGFLRQVGRLLRPGGMVILIEPDLWQFADGKPEREFTFGSGPRAWFLIWETYRGCLSMLGIDTTVPQQFKRLLEETDLFDNINVHEGIIPVGFNHTEPTALTVGQLQWMAHDLLLPALKPMFVHLGILESRVDRMIQEAQRDLYSSDFELSSHLHIVWATRRSYDPLI
ncbi:S-adenosyl-L-methionine-dependent methyltransferase [Mycena maculata]|uniref:S-adenosyl-L-methionine-dependent methyltransferase n=1 Tax=Mycena maculata TaxID=230809 RepID=A0AAD7JYD0_9AGAR|nr:S-adenosyl-L-methionine-dependent methyltransferase [Mycena maculata]